MPSKEEICDPSGRLSSEVEELVFHIKHNFQLKSKPNPTFSSKQRRMSPYSAPCRSKNKDCEHSPSNCKFCMLRSKSSKAASNTNDPYEILTLLSKGILINEAVKRLQMDTNSKKKTDFYESEDPDVCVNPESV